MIIVLLDLEKELDFGVLRSFDPATSCQIFVREIVDLRNYVSHAQAPRFIELERHPAASAAAADNNNNNSDGDGQHHVVDEVAFDWLRSLKQHRIPAVLPQENIHPFSVLWRYESGVDVTLHSDYIDDLVTRFEVNMVDLIDKLARRRAEVTLPAIIEEITQHWLVARNRTRNFIGREPILETIQSYVISNDNRPLVVYGEAGAGKTSIMAKAASSVRTHDQIKYKIVVLVFTAQIYARNDQRMRKIT